ncbi:unnamed protein product [Trichobilharzia regenti]|nr:unnamed protein product [Trichobilharzia regenti]
MMNPSPFIVVPTDSLILVMNYGLVMVMVLVSAGQVFSQLE